MNRYIRFRDEFRVVVNFHSLSYKSTKCGVTKLEESSEGRGAKKDCGPRSFTALENAVLIFCGRRHRCERTLLNSTVVLVF